MSVAWESLVLAAVMGLLAVGLGVLISVLLGIAAFYGSWVQRSIGYVIRTRAEKELLDQATEREERRYEDRRVADFQAARTTRAEEAMEKVSRVSPAPSPLGDPIPSPEELDNLMEATRGQRDFTADLGTERMKEAMSDG